MTTPSTLHATDLLAHADPRDPSSWRLDPGALADSALDMARVAPDDACLELLGALGAPALDVLVTPMSTRAALLGARVGRRFFHHELRRRIPMPDHMAPEVDVWGGETTPVWQNGVLEEPKYFSFFMDAPLPSFNPNHRRKWRAHELLHGAVGFYWRPDLTRFEFYVSARLGELVPVVHWYGLDEILRPRCPKHLHGGARRAHCPDCDAVAAPYWTLEHDDAARDAARALAASSLEHFRSEWEACALELEHGVTHPTPRGRLDASSDAVGYLMGHWPRVTAASFGEWVERFLRPNIDYHDRLGAYAARVAETFASLLSGDLSVDQHAAQALATRRAIHDLAYRALLVTEWVDDARYTRARDMIDPHLDALTDLSDALLSPDADLDALTDHARTSGRALLGALTQAPFDTELGAHAHALGHDLLDTPGDAPLHPTSQALLAEGVAQVTPEFASPPEDLDAFSTSDAFHDLGPLVERLTTFLREQAHPDAALFDLQLWLERPGRDADAEAFGALPEDPSELLDADSTLRLNTTARRATFSRDVLAHALPDLARQLGAEHVELLGVTLNGTLRIAHVDGALSSLLDALSQDDRASVVAQADLAERLLYDGVLVWLPAPRI